MNKKLPNISVIIAAYNVAGYIGETLASVFAQTAGDYEVIVINDGSQDVEELAAALAPYRDSIVYLSQKNRGLAAARNVGLRAAQGRYVAFLDADDLWEPEFLREQCEHLERGPYDLVYADARLFGDPMFAGRTFMEIAPSVGEVTFETLMAGHCNIIGSAVVARRESLFEAGLFDETLRNAQDFDLWIRMALRGARLGYQRKILARYRYREGSLSGDAVNRVNRELRVFQKVLTTYDLTREQRTQVDLAIRISTRELNLVQGKEQLDQREFDKARASFREADVLRPSLKLKLVRLILLISPNLLRRSTSLAARWRLLLRSAIAR
jgi:glycosyltransferase involved in cell wall biosynthesis